MEEGSTRLEGRGRRYSAAVFLIDDGDDAVFINHALSDGEGVHRSLVRATILFQSKTNAYKEDLKEQQKCWGGDTESSS